jgi:flavin-dependent dehydrogenase
MTSEERREVVVVGGGPAGAAVATRLARLGRDVLVLERAPAWRWRACGVFTSSATVVALGALGVEHADLARVARPVQAMRVETLRGTRFRLTYGDDGSMTHAAIGLDRSALDPFLLGLAREAGAEVREGATVRGMRGDRLTLADGSSVTADVVVGADGLRSVVARDGGAVGAPPLGGRPALTFHVAEPGATDGQSRDRPRDARMIVFDGGYVGLAPVPERRVNVGIVLISAAWRRRLRDTGAAETAAEVMRAIPDADDDPVPWTNPTICDAVEGASPVGLRVRRRAGDGWLLIGDASGFLDPFTGEGLHRALLTAELAAAAVDRHLSGDAAALRRYERAVDRRVRTKDLVSRVVQAFVAHPGAFDRVARRLAAEPDLRETMGLVIGDLAPASAALHPRFLVRLLRP